MFELASTSSAVPSSLLDQLPGWLSPRVAACVAAAVGLVVFSFLLKGMQKLITIVALAALVLGIYWFTQEAFGHRSTTLPPALKTELDGLAARTLESPEAQAAWAELQQEWAKFSGPAKERLAKGGDAARAVVAQKIDARAAELRKAGKKGAAEELQRFRGKVSP